jgi:hypothetical protein
MTGAAAAFLPLPQPTLGVSSLDLGRSLASGPFFFCGQALASAPRSPPRGEVRPSPN